MLPPSSILSPSKSEDKLEENSNQMFYGIVIIIVLVVSAIIIYSLSLQTKNNRGYTERYESESRFKPDEYEREGGSFIYYPYL
jgi:hypothetical protein